jgi:hypothetical protein
VLIEQWELRLFKEMIVAINFKENLTIDLDGSFHRIEHRIFEIKGSEDSRNVKSQNFIWGSPRSWPRSHGEMERSCAKDEAPELVTEKDCVASRCQN